jgi:Rieske Fe-S protein
MSAGIALRGTAYAFTDDRFLDLTLQGNRILVINPLTRPGYVAMSGVCTHEGCSPFYLAKCLYSVPDGGTPQCAVPDSDAGKEGGTEAGQEDAGAETGMPDRESDAGSDDASDADIDADENEMPLTDILFCPCHQSVYNAITGVPLLGPATLTGSLQILETCVDDGYVFVTIPRNPGAP